MHLHLLILACLFCLGSSNLFYPLGTGDSCEGSGEITVDGLNVEVAYDASNAYKADGWTKSKNGRYYRFTICGQLANSTCDGDWSFEEVNKTNKDECIEALARWEENENTTITYNVVYNETTNIVTGNKGPDKPIALHIEIVDHNQINKECPNKESHINYTILCKPGVTTQFLNLYEDYTNCSWNVYLQSPYGCVTETFYNISNNNNNTIAMYSTSETQISTTHDIYTTAGSSATSATSGGVSTTSSAISNNGTISSATSGAPSTASTTSSTQSTSSSTMSQTSSSLTSSTAASVSQVSSTSTGTGTGTGTGMMSNTSMNTMNEMNNTNFPPMGYSTTSGKNGGNGSGSSGSSNSSSHDELIEALVAIGILIILIGCVAFCYKKGVFNDSKKLDNNAPYEQFNDQLL